MLKHLRACVIEDPVVRLDEFGGDFELDVRSDLFSRVATNGYYEPELADRCRSWADTTRDALDVGANVGFFTCMLARTLPSRRVLAIEPTPAALARLRRNIKRNGVADRVAIFSGAAADEGGQLTMNTVPGREEYSSLGALLHPSIGQADTTTIAIEARTVDQLVAEHGLVPGFIKIDVEGAEARVLRGAVETLRSHRPVVMAELSDTLLRVAGSSAREVVKFMDGHGYNVVDPLNPERPAFIRDFGEMLCLPRVG